MARRCCMNFQLRSRKWHWQRGLERLGYRDRCDLSKIKLSLAGELGPGLAIPMPFSSEDIRQSYKWTEAFCKNLTSSLEQRAAHTYVWESLQVLTRAEIWQEEEVPTQLLQPLATHCGMEVGDVAEEWIAVRAQVRPRLILPAHDRLQDPRDFGAETLLPALANAPDGRLKDLLSTALLSISKCAEFERDMKAIRELWRKRTKRIDPRDWVCRSGSL